MGFLDAIFGRKTPAADTLSADERAIAKYEQALRTAEPADLERVHTEAFGKLTPEQRDLMFEQFVERAVEADERPADAAPGSLGKTATLVELRRPGTMRSILDGPAGSRLWTEPNHTFYAAFAGYFIASQLASSLWWDDGSASGAAATGAYAGDGSQPDPGHGSGGSDSGWGGGFFGGDGGGGFGGGDGGGGGF
jgi:hypothetical protein